MPGQAGELSSLVSALSPLSEEAPPQDHSGAPSSCRRSLPSGSGLRQSSPVPEALPRKAYEHANGLPARPVRVGSGQGEQSTGAKSLSNSRGCLAPQNVRRLGLNRGLAPRAPSHSGCTVGSSSKQPPQCPFQRRSLQSPAQCWLLVSRPMHSCWSCRDARDQGTTASWP